MADEGDITEFLILREMPQIPNSDISIEQPEVPVLEPTIFIWNHNKTLMFLDLYKKYRRQVGNYKIKNIKKMFEIIAQELQQKLNAKVLPAQCENRWKVLERGYRKYVDSNNKTGQGRRNFEYAEAMDDILGEKKNIKPVLLLSSETISQSNDTPGPLSGEEHHTEERGTNNTEKQETSALKKRRLIYKQKINKIDVIKQMRADRQEYYAKRFGQEEHKINELKRQNDLTEQKISALQKSNELSEIRNNILKEYSEKGDSIFASACD